MIQIEQVTLPVAIRESIEEWLIQPARHQLFNVIQHRIAELQAEAVNVAVPDAGPFSPTGDVTGACKKKLDEAGRWRLFLDKLAECSDPGFNFKTVRLSVPTPSGQTESDK